MQNHKFCYENYRVTGPAIMPVSVSAWHGMPNSISICRTFYLTKFNQEEVAWKSLAMKLINQKNQ